ncbi:MAG: glycosyltransferase [Microbacteriaceae bacterium]|nr:glycosyltransferase [Microbacteriaceae bacterium]
MGDAQLRVAMVTMHTSPLDRPGTRDAGGMNVAVLSLARELAKQGAEVDLITRSETTASKIKIADRLNLIELRSGAFGALPKDELYLAAEEFGDSVRSLISSQGEPYGVLHAHYWLSGVATLPVAKDLGIPFVQTFHTLAALKELKSSDDPSLVSRRHRAEMELAAKADGIVAVSKAEANSMNGVLRAAGERLWIIPHGVDTQLFDRDRWNSEQEVKTELGVESDQPLLLVVGRVQPHKAQHLAIRCLSEATQLTSKPPVLAIVGEPTPGEESYYWELVDLAADLGISKLVRFVGALDREQLAKWMAASDLTLLTSQSETFGLVALESAASGTPVVAFKGSGMLEAVSEGKSGTLVDSRDPRQWAKVVQRILDDREALTQLRRSSREFALGYSWAQAGSGLLGVYSALIDRIQAK